MCQKKPSRSTRGIVMNLAARSTTLGVIGFPYILRSWRKSPKLSIYQQPEFVRTVCRLHTRRHSRSTYTVHGRWRTRDDLWTLSSASSPSSYAIRSIPWALGSAKVAPVLSNRAALSANRVASFHTSATSCDCTNTSATATTTATMKSKSGEEGNNFELVYRGPLRSAVRAVKVFSLTTCAAALVGGPVLVIMGNPSVPLLGRALMTAFVMTIGVSTTLILHWLMKGYVIDMYFDPKSENLRVYTLTMFAGKRCHTFHLSEAGPPENIAAFSTFQAKGKSFFMHTEVMENKELLGKILGPYMKLEDKEFWKQNEEVSNNSNIQQDKA